MQNSLIYMDYNATTPVDSRVLDVMLPYFRESFGNAASKTHAFGWEAKKAVDGARLKIASLINAHAASDIVFTSGATESVNLAIKGVQPELGKRHIVTVQTEHKAVLDSCQSLEKSGISVTYLDVNSDGLIDLNRLAQAITDQTYLVSIMAANNETGVLQDIKSIGQICHDRGVLFHTDATQAIGKIPFDVRDMNVDLASFSAHKVYGPKGVGALYVKASSLTNRLAPQMHGGGHEGGYRSGTLNVPGIVGFAKALDICVSEMPTEQTRITNLRNRLFDAISRDLNGVQLNGHPEQRLPGTLNLSFAQVDVDSLLLEMPEVAVSSGSACTSAKVAPSHVLKALGISDELARSSLRFGIGRFNTEEEIDFVAKRCVEAVRNVRATSSLAFE